MFQECENNICETFETFETFVKHLPYSPVAIILVNSCIYGGIY